MADDEMDPELAALLAQLDAPSAPPPPPGAKKASPAFGGGLKKAPASFSSGVGAPPPPPMTGKFGAVPKSPAGSAAGLAVRGSSVGVGAAPPPPPLTGLGKATSSVVAGAGAPKAPPPGSFGKSGGGVVSPPSAPVASRSSYASPSSSTAQLKKFCCFFDDSPSYGGGGAQGYDVQLQIDENSIYEDVCVQLLHRLPWHTGGSRSWGALPPKPASPAQIFLKPDEWSCARESRMKDLGWSSQEGRLYFTVSTPGRIVWASMGEINGVQYMLNNRIMTVDELFIEVAAVDRGSVASTLKFLIEKGADLSKPDLVKNLITEDHGSADWRRWPTAETWALLFSNPRCPVNHMQKGMNLIQFFATCSKAVALRVCPVLAGRGLNPDGGDGTSAKLHCTRNGWYDVIDAMETAYKRVAGASSSPSTAPKAAASGGGGGGAPDPKFEAIVKALVELAVQTHDDKYLRKLREVCSAYGWRV